MTLSISWHIANMQREAADGYVYKVDYTVKALDTAVGSVSQDGSVHLDRGEDLVPYEALDEALVIQWVKDALGVEQVHAIEDQLSRCLSDRQSVQQPLVGLPW